ncbi:transcription-repair coupling factor (superfamily II helicase) [Devosia crocina]|uniref:Transcription-repair-coupling factor n=1 Tax=Devosia crocina TaxID=429728 RepID=A0A1I7NUY8_9HYPH|nr:DEAD/DEAH box helicase [Devosia crocina]SFV38464.1 transcription-repair coupling factor (superfamily II helicase) [Devosia crocina]
MDKRDNPAMPAPLSPAGVPNQEAAQAKPPTQAPAAAVGFRLAQAFTGSSGSLCYIASSERRSEETARALACFAPEADRVHLRPWDCLPYDRARPSSESMGRRMASLRRLAEPSSVKYLVLTSPQAIVQKVPPRAVVAKALLTLRAGDGLDREAFERFVLATGYVIDDRVDEPGEVALRGNVVEVFPADADAPIRITEEDGTMASMTRYDARSQRSLDEITVLDLGPASELIADEPCEGEADEHRIGEWYDALETVFDYLPDARLVASSATLERIEEIFEQIQEAHATASEFGGARKPRPVDELYLDAAAWRKASNKAGTLDLDLDGLEAVPDFSAARSAGSALSKFVEEQLTLKRAVVICGSSAEAGPLQRILRRQRIEAEELDGAIFDICGTAGVFTASFDLDEGFIDAEAGLAVVAAADVLGTRLHQTRSAEDLLAPVELRVGDVVVHEDHGVGILEDLTRIEVDGLAQDTIRLGYHGGATLMVPVEDFSKVWRYGAEPEAVTLDRLNTDAWHKKRAKVSAEIEEAAARLAELAEDRLAAKAPVLRTPKSAYQRLAARFPYAETPDQAAAIAAVLDDIGSGRQMNRLICGDVGFGKTEVALRAAAAAALAGKQVAMVAPTTVLARQHLHSFERRFAGTDISVGHLSRLNSAAENKQVKTQLESGELRIVVATHAIAADDVSMPELGLVILDEEQRFGARIKRQLHEMAQGVHMLSMSATPIPRTLQAAMVGLQDASIIATPPARRRPIRTFFVPYDAASARTALLREKRRNGQSFVVVPRIEDIETLAAELARIVPDLVVVKAHGELPAKEIDTVLLGFANGEGDVLLATNIIESGLDVPRANTMLIWRADRFGLAQLHQLRGRVGRGRAQGIAYLYTEPDQEISETTRARLSTLEAFDRLGAGFEISARDLELRGAGDLLGEDQAGHLHLIGASLYQQLLEQALRRAKGEQAETMRTARLNLGLSGSFPVDYLPEAVLRINLYARLQRLRRAEEIDDFADELEDRFGERPAEVDLLLDLARFGIKAADLGVVQIDAGPLAIALTPADKRAAKRLAAASKTFEATGERLVHKLAEGTQPLEALTALLDQLTAAIKR